MLRALQLSRHGASHVEGNPMVGAVVVADGRIIGEGWHRRFGEAHAEVNAIASIRDADRHLLTQSTIYVTLEPCCHYGKTPPCADLIIRSGIPRVVVGCLDPFPKVAGGGVGKLRAAGIDVEVGVLEQPCREINERFLYAHEHKLPWVLLKWAQTADGFIAADPEVGENPLRMSTPLTMRLMHRVRSMCQAIVVGANTVTADNPALTTRYWPAGEQPLRVVLDKNLSAPADARLFTDGAPTIVYNAMKDATEGATQWVKMASDDPANWLKNLYERGINTVMVEGGACVLEQLIATGCWNEARIEVSPRRIGSGVLAPRMPRQMAENLKIGHNSLIFYRNHVKKV